MSVVELRDTPQNFRKEALPLPPGNLFLRLLAARAIASVKGATLADVVTRLWPSDKIVLRAASAPAMTTVSGWAAELAIRVVADGLQALGAASAGAQALQHCLVLPFAGYGSISAPALVAGAGNAGFVAEGDPIPVRQLLATGAILSPHKLAAIGVLTREMIDYANADQLVGDTLMRSAGLGLDAVLFDANAATAARPAGLRNGIAAQTASTSTELLEAFYQDVATLIGAVSAVGGDGPFVIVGAPGRVAGMHLRFIGEARNVFAYGSSAVGNDLIAIACPGVAAALSPDPDLETSNAATLHMDDAPSAVGSAGPHRSLFQTETIALKMRWPVTWAVRDPRAVAWLTPTWN